MSGDLVWLATAEAAAGVLITARYVGAQLCPGVSICCSGGCDC